MRWLIGYSTCDATRAAIEAKGHEVWTCDLRAADHPRHLQCDIWDVATDRWDAAIFHPTCTYLTCSAAWAFADPDFDRYPSVGYHQRVTSDTLTGQARHDAREAAIANFRRLLALPYPKAIENPAPSFISRAIRSPDQTIQPYDFGGLPRAAHGGKMSRCRNCHEYIGDGLRGLLTSCERCRDKESEPAATPATVTLKPCPFCGSDDLMVEGKGRIWRGTGGFSDPQYFELRHDGRLSETDDFPRCSILFRHRTAEDAIASWNSRAAATP